MIGYVAKEFIPVMITFDEEYVEMVVDQLGLIMERTIMSNALFGDYEYEQEEF